MRKLTAYLVKRSPTHNHMAGAIRPLLLNQHQQHFSGGQES
jgi:hypothetical protein